MVGRLQFLEDSMMCASIAIKAIIENAIMSAKK